MRKGYVDGPFGQVHYREAGSGPVLMLFHQAPMSSKQYLRVLPLFAERGYRAIAVDAPGFGNSSPPDHVPDIADYARSGLAVLDGLGLDSVIAIGHHTGAMVATELSLIAPERVSKLIMHGPFPIKDEAERAQYMKVVDNERAFTPMRDGSHLEALWQARIRWLKEEDGPQLVTNYLVDQLSGEAPFWYGHNAAFSYDHGDALRRVGVPALILSNTGDMAHPKALEAKAIRPDMAFEAIEGGEIDIADQMPEAWVAAILRFVEG